MCNKRQEIKTEPFLYQLLRKMENDKKNSQDRKFNRNHLKEQDQENINFGNQRMKKESEKQEASQQGQIQGQGENLMNNIELNELKKIENDQNQENEENFAENQEIGEEEDPNQMYLSEPMALDVTADSDILKEFDHEESVENYS